MPETGLVWECTCGHSEIGEVAPEECPSCYSLNSFVQLPQEIVEIRRQDKAEEMLMEESMGLEDIEEPKMLGKVKKTKKKTTKKSTKKKENRK